MLECYNTMEWLIAILNRTQPVMIKQIANDNTTISDNYYLFSK